MAKQFHRSFRALTLERDKPYVCDECSSDFSRTKKYRINSVGFRGPEYDGAAAKDLYVFGCSVTFGVGLNEDEVWCHHIANRYCTQQQISREKLNLMNFASSGASNQEIARNVLMQCAVRRPDLAMVQFTFPDRWEIARGDRTAFIGNWTPKAWWENADVREIASDEFLHYTHEQGCLDMMRMFLLAQSFLIAHQINYLIIAAYPPGKLTRLGRVLMRLLDHKKIVWLPSLFSRTKAKGQFDPEAEPKAADDLHPGPTVHTKAAEFIWNRYLKVSGNDSILAN